MLLAPVQIARAPSPIRFFHHHPLPKKTRLLRLLSSSFPFLYILVHTNRNMCVCVAVCYCSQLFHRRCLHEKRSRRLDPLSCCCCLSTSVWCLTVSADSHLCLFSQWSYSFFWLFHFLFILLPLNFLARDPTGFFTHLSKGYTQLHSPPSLFPPPIYPTVVTLNLFFRYFPIIVFLYFIFVFFFSFQGRSDFFFFCSAHAEYLSKSWVDVGARSATPISLSLRSTWPRSKDNHNKKPSQNNNQKSTQKKSERKEVMRYYPGARRKSWWKSFKKTNQKTKTVCWLELIV